MDENQDQHKVLEELDQHWRHTYAEKLAAWEKFRWEPFDEALLAEYEARSETVLNQTRKIIDCKRQHGI